MARPERLLGAARLVPRGTLGTARAGTRASNLARRLARLVELPTPWFVVRANHGTTRTEKTTRLPQIKSPIVARSAIASSQIHSESVSHTAVNPLSVGGGEW